VSVVPAGPSFFSTAQFSLLQQAYGAISVFRVGNTWVLVGSGQDISSSSPMPPASKDGPMVALETCASSATACLDPNTAHQPGDFTAVALPDPTAYPIEAEAAEADSVLIVFDGAQVGPVQLDLATRQWYSATTPLQAILSKTADPLTITATTHRGAIVK
jgi:hypothetical protein